MILCRHGDNVGRHRLLSKSKGAESPTRAEAEAGSGTGQWTVANQSPALSLQLRKILALDHFFPIPFLKVGFKSVRLTLNLM